MTYMQGEFYTTLRGDILKDKENLQWKINDIANQYKTENPDWSMNKCFEKANIIYKELKKLNNRMWHNNKIYFKYNKPFSFFFRRDSEFSDVSYDWEE